MIFDIRLLMWVAPAMILGFVAQQMVRTAYAKGSQVAARMSGFQAARQLLDAAGLQGVGIEQTPGRLSDHYDPRAKVLRLSGDVYHGRSMAAVGIAAHEAGHAIQDGVGYVPLVVRNMAVPMANYGSNVGIILLMVGVVMSSPPLLLVGIVLFCGVVFFQVVNLPVEFNASSRAKAELINHGIITPQELTHVSKVLNAAALTYVAATLQSILTLLYYIMRYSNRR